MTYISILKRCYVIGTFTLNSQRFMFNFVIFNIRMYLPVIKHKSNKIVNVFLKVFLFDILILKQVMYI